MQLAPDRAQAFIDFYSRLMHFAGQKRGIISKEVTLEAFKAIDMDKRVKCRDALYKPKPLFSTFLQEHGQALTPKEHALVEAWIDHHVYDQFVILRHLKQHTIFVDSKSPARVYGACSLLDDLNEIVPSEYLPQIVHTALLPYDEVIVYDGLMLGYNIMIGSNMRRDLKDLYERAKVEGRFYISLTDLPKPPSPEELLAYKIKEKGETPIRKVRGLAAQVKKVKQLEWELADTTEKKRAKLEQQLAEARLKIADMVVEFYEKDIDKE